VRSKSIIMLAVALVFGIGAVLVGQRWLDRQASQRLREMQASHQPRAEAPKRTLVVAGAPLRFGDEVTRQSLREIPWPGDAVPKGAFSRIDEVIDGKTRRVALAALEENEPVLAPKITGPGQRASLAAVVAPGMKAVTVRVNDVNGVAGFVLPGERVDVMMVRNLDRNEAYADVLLQNVRVLAADQTADDKLDRPSVVKAVTLEVSTNDAQRLTLAATIAQLSLTLRSAGVAELEATRRVGVEDLLTADPRPQAPAAFVNLNEAPETRRTTSVGVTRGMKRQDYAVPVMPGADAGLGTASTAKAAAAGGKSLN
jgi:pilus assembly protein CpaB